ncbi:hypothetical protein CVT91_13135 [Candidatus Atribacteria bacterium HGW-Atribacteria-1]|nr:MAG: hypothetical protein CVT91_13135 [Candidatus Atribacteria bacterium HGW-Atribacteria-1]
MNIFSFLHFFVFLFYSCLLIFLLWKDPKSLLNRACAAFFACLALWSFAYIFVHNFNISKDTAILFDNISSIGWANFASFFLWFSLIFTEKKKILKTKIIYPLIFILPLLFIYTQWAGLLTTNYIKRPWGWEAAWSSSILWYSYFIYYLSFTAIGLYLILNFRRKTKEPIKKKQAGIIFVATLITLLLGFFTEVILSGLNIYTIPLMGDVNTLCWAFGIVFAMAKYKLMVITPAAAADNIVSTIADSLILLDREGNIATVNKATLDLSGYGKDELKGKSVEIFFRGKDFKSILLDRAIKGKVIRNYELNFKTKSKSNIPTLFSSSAMMDEAGGMAGIVCIVKDITERKQAEEKLKKTMDATLGTMSKIIEVKDPYTSGHQQRVCQLAVTLARELGLPEDKIEGIRIASLIHDIGKIGLPAEILSKPTKLTDIEFSLIKSHSQIGYDVLKSIDFSYPIAQIVLQHHERLNGSGYPNHLKGDKILLEAKIIEVADVVEAMSSFRPYRPALGIDKALEEISQNKDILYDPEVVDACLKLFKEKGFKFE